MPRHGNLFNKLIKMRSIIKLRQQLGFCQEDMARMLGVKRSMVVRAEACRGDLPAHAYLKKKLLDEYLADTAAIEDLELKDQQFHLLEKLKNQLADCILKSRRIRRNLEKHEKIFKVTQVALKMLVKMEAEGNEYPPTWLAATRTKLEERLAKCSPSVTTLLKIKLEGLLSEERALNEEIRTTESRIAQVAEKQEDKSASVEEKVEVTASPAVPNEQLIKASQPRFESMTITESISRSKTLFDGYTRHEVHKPVNRYKYSFIPGAWKGRAVQLE